MAFLIKNLFLKAKKLMLKLEKISTQDFSFLQWGLPYRLKIWFNLTAE